MATYSLRHSRWRAWVRKHTPRILYDAGLVIPKAADCGSHEWYVSTPGIQRCYHCRAERSQHETLTHGALDSPGE